MTMDPKKLPKNCRIVKRDLSEELTEIISQNYDLLQDLANK